MLSEVAVKGFRCFDPEGWHRLPLAQETIIMGPNNSGKSALLSVIDFYRVSFWGFPSRSFNFNSEIHRWGGPGEFYHPTLYESALRGETAELSLRLKVENQTKCTIEATHSGGWNSRNIWESAEDEIAIRDGIQGIWHLRPIRPEFPTAVSVGSSGSQFQPVLPDGRNAIQFLLERYTSRDPDWDEAEKWLKRIDPHMNLLMVPLRGNAASIETGREYEGDLTADINIANQGTGIQSACSVVAALVFSPPGTTIIIEEPEAYLHPRSKEVIVDLMNKAVNEWGKQVIATTHSWDIILPFISDIGTGSERGKQHINADPEKFSLVMMDDDHNIMEYSLEGKPFRKVRDDAKKLWG